MHFDLSVGLGGVAMIKTERISTVDLKRFSDAVCQVHETTHLESFPRRVVDIVGNLLRSASTHYAELNPLRKRVFTIANPEPANLRALTPVFERYMHQHPVIRYHRLTGDGSAHRVSDFLTDRQYHRLPLYNEAYRPTGLEHQMSITLEAPKPLLIGIVVHRTLDDIDFTERDRLLMNMIRPHLLQAYEAAERIEQIECEMAAAKSSLESLDQGVVVLDRQLQVKSWTRKAWIIVCRHFSGESLTGKCLPEALRAWVVTQIRREGRPPSAFRPWIQVSGGARLTIRLIPDLAGGQFLLTLDETLANPCAGIDRLMTLDLTRREAEVLCWVSEGHTNNQVADVLGLSARTVQKHLERVFTKLDVQTRTAAVAVAMRVRSA